MKNIRKILLFFVMFFFFNFKLFAAVNYDFNTVFTIPWGNSDTSVGYKQSFDKNLGPSSFYIIGNNVYLIDAVNNKIKKYDIFNKTLTTLSINLPDLYFTDIVLDSKQNIYLLGIDNIVYEYSQTGDLINKIELSEKIKIINNLKLINDELYVLTSSQWMYLIKNKYQILSKREQLNNFIEGNKVSDNNLYKTKIENKNTGIISELNEQGVSIKNITIGFNSNKILTFIFLDKVNNSYFTISETDNKGNTPPILKNLRIYNSIGQEEFKINIPFIYYTFLNKEFQIDENGNIYQMISRPEGITLIKLIRKVTKSITIKSELNYPSDFDTPYNFNDNLKPEPTIPTTRSIERPTTSATTVTRSEALVIAEAYRDLNWTASAGNISSGAVVCGDGHTIRTPTWITTGSKIAVPYKWGGFSSIETYLSQVAAGKYAGSDYTSDVSWGDNYDVGVDCSGFVSRCWRLASKQGTTTLPNMSVELSGYDDMKTGDIINKSGSHVRLFVKKEENGTYSFIEAMGTYWRVMSRNYTASYISSYLPRRYDNMLEIETPKLTFINNSTGTDMKFYWNLPTDANVDNINIYLSEDGDSFYKAATVAAGSGNTTIAGLTDGKTYYCNATFDSGGREGLYSSDYIFRVTSGTPNVLIVEDESRYGSQNSSKFFGEPLTENNYYYDICNSTAVINNLVSLSDYWAVIWFTGRASSSGDISLNTQERAKIQTFLDNGGNLFISGQDIAYALDNQGLDVSFLNNYLKAGYAADDAGNNVALLGNSSTVLDGLSFELDEDNGLVDDGGAYDARWPDKITVSSGGTELCSYDVGGVGGVCYKGSYSGTEAAMVYFSFPFETIKNISDRNTVMSKILSYFGTPPGNEAPIISMETEYSESPSSIFSIQLIANDNNDTYVNLNWTISDTNSSLWNSIQKIEGDTDYLIFNAKSNVGVDTINILVKDSDLYIDTISIVVNLSLVEIPDTPEIYFIKNVTGVNSAYIEWKHDNKAYKYIIYKSTDNSIYTASDTIYSPNVSTTISGLSNNTKYYFKILSYNSVDTPSSSYSMTLGFRTIADTSDCLLVEDDFSHGVHSYIAKFVGALNGANKSFDCAIGNAIVDGAIDLSDYKSVIWSCGDDDKNHYTSLNTEEREKIKAYLDNGGKLFISGNNIATDLNSLDPDFYERYLKAGYGYFKSYRYELRPNNWGVLDGASNFYIYTDDAGSTNPGVSGAAYQALNSDRTNLVGTTENANYGGKTTLKYWDSGWTAGIDFTGGFGISSDGDYLETSEKLSKLVNFTFAFECINDLGARHSIMSKIIDYFDSSSVAGRVSMNDRTDYTGANVYLMDNSNGDSSVVTTDSLGRYRFDFIKTGNYYLNVKCDTYTDWTSQVFGLETGVDTFILVMLSGSGIIYNPNIKITSPENQIETNSQSVLITGTTKDTLSGDSIEIFINNSLQDNYLITSSNENFNFTINLNNTENTVVVRLNSPNGIEYDTVNVYYGVNIITTKSNVDTINIASKVSNAGCTITLVYYDTPTQIVMQTQTDINGNYNLSGILDGHYKMVIKYYNTLQRIVEVTVTNAQIIGNINIPDLISGDANNDNIINSSDLSILGTYYNSSLDLRCDFNGDNIVDTNDYLILKNNYNLLGQNL